MRMNLFKHFKMQLEACFDWLAWWHAFMSFNFQMLDFLPMKLLGSKKFWNQN
jgi:hypothetical protein